MVPARTMRIAAISLARPYRIEPAMLILFALIPLYVLIPFWYPPAARFRPELPIDRAIPLVPAWSLVYGAVYMWLILTPVFVVRDHALARRMYWSYVSVWAVSYLFFFILYPTAAPRPESIAAVDFGTWGLSALYGADPPINCFPSLHVAHSFVGAFACMRVHRRLGAVAMVAATLVALSTVFTKQHYVLDVVAGIALAAIAAAVLLRIPVDAESASRDRDAAASLALVVGALSGLALAGAWLFYLML